MQVPRLHPAFALSLLVAASGARAQSLPPTAPTALQTGSTAPLAGVAGADERPGMAHHRAAVSCANGELTIHADNSSLNGILRAIARCTGMTIAGGVADQRVFGDYGPAAPATVLATLLDGTGVNMLLQETAADQPAHLILTPRTGGATPPSPNQVQDDDDADLTPPAQPTAQPINRPMPRQAGVPSNTLYATQGTDNPQPTLAEPTAQPNQGIGNRPGSAVTSPQQIPQPINNVNGSPSNTSPTASTYPTTNSVSTDALPTPSTTPSSNGIVDAPNPPPAGSDTAALLNGNTSQVPANTSIQNGSTANTTSPGATNTTQPAGNAAPGNGSLTPQQVFDQLRQMQQQLQQGQSTGTQGSSQPTGSTTPQ